MKKDIKFYIPFSKDTIQLNYDLVMFFETTPEIFYENYKIGAFYGSFGYCVWCGGSRNHLQLATKSFVQEVANFMHSHNIPLRLTFTNSALTTNNLYDSYGNMMLDVCSQGNNEVLVACETMENYIKTQWPQYKVIKSTCWSEIVPYDDSDRFYMSVLNRRKNSDDVLLKNIENKNKIEVVLNERCYPNCPYTFRHYQKNDEGFLNYDFDNDYCIQHHHNNSLRNNPFFIKNLREQSNEYVTKDRMENFFIPNGFSNFKIVGRNYNVIYLVQEIAYYMVKPEYQEDFCSYILQKYIKTIV